MPIVNGEPDVGVTIEPDVAKPLAEEHAVAPARISPYGRRFA